MPLKNKVKKSQNSILTIIFLYLIKIYQKIFSPDHSKFGKSRQFSGCRYFPTCSHYAQLTLKESGFFKGFFKIISRIFRCNPFSKGGIDFPSKKTKQAFLKKNR